MLFVSFFGAFAQNTYLPRLKKQLDSLLREDQMYREMFAFGTYKTKEDSLCKVFNVAPSELFKAINSRMIAADTSNTRMIKYIISIHGYPGKSLVGDEASSVAWSVLQHSNRIADYLDIVKKAAKKDELEKKYASLMEDRVLMYAGKPQIYGTQGSYRKLSSGKSEMVVWPIKNPKGVNKRRKKMGFDTSVEENAKLMGITYRVVSMEELGL